MRYMFVEEGALPILTDGMSARSPADMALAGRLSIEHTDEELRAMSDEATGEFWRLHREARRTLGPIGLIASIATTIVVLFGGLAVCSAIGMQPLLSVIGAMAATAFSGRAVADRFERSVEDRSRDALVRAHSLRVAVHLRRIRRWWEAYDAAGRPPIDL